MYTVGNAVGEAVALCCSLSEEARRNFSQLPPLGRVFPSQGPLRF